MEALRFLWRYIRSPRVVGAVAPSSRFLVEAMLAPVDWTTAKRVVEFGPGTGVMTREILRRLGKGALAVFEVHPGFVSQLRSIKDARLQVHHRGAETLDFAADAIVSSLPLGSLPTELSRQILANAAQRLHPGGVYVQFQYSRLRERLLRERFASVTRSWVPLNLPPAFVYVCRKA